MPIFKLNSDDLPPIIELLEEALLNRPEPSGIEHYDIDDAISSAEAYSEAIDKLSEPYVELDAWDFECIVQDMVDGYNTFWERPFPEGLEAGQFLFSAILEKPMKELLKNLKKILNNLELGDDEPLISIDAEKEVDAFNAWLQQQKTKKVANYRSSNSLELIIAAGLFGYWLGSRK